MQAIVIYGPQGCGKTLRADDMKAYFGKARVVDLSEFAYQRLPEDAVVLTNAPIPAGKMQRYEQPVQCVSFDAFLREAGLVEKHAAEIERLRSK
jgi:hypothetical protein